MAGELLFPIALEAGRRILGAAVEWQTKRFLNTTVRCPNGCVTFAKKIPNRSNTNFHCHKCKAKFVDQHSHATRNTVQNDLSLTAAYAQNFRWQESRSAFLGRLLGYYPVMDVLTVNSRDHDVVLKYEIIQQDRKGKNASYAIPLSPTSHSHNFNSVATGERLELPDEGEQLTVHAYVENAFGEKLHSSAAKLLTRKNGIWRPAGS